jgi:hypothetical protein
VQLTKEAQRTTVKSGMPHLKIMIMEIFTKSGHPLGGLTLISCTFSY